MSKGKLIVFEGIDGTGKTSQLKALAAFLKEQGYVVTATREPSDGPYGQKIRTLFTKRNTLTLEEELELFIADRKHHVQEVIVPALERGEIVLTDRYYFSTVAYQGAAGGDPEKILAKNSFAPIPDLVLLLTITVAESIRRIQEQRQDQLNDFECEEQLISVAAIFDSFQQPWIKRIDASGCFEQVQLLIRGAVAQMLGFEVNGK